MNEINNGNTVIKFLMTQIKIYKKTQFKILWLVVIFTVLIGCFAENGKEKKTTKKEATQIKVKFDGLVVASNATELRAPRNYFLLNGWVSDHAWIDLKQLAEDGTEVKKGDLIGGFEFRGERSLPGIEAKIARTEALEEEALSADSDSIRLLNAEMKKANIRSQRYELELSRGETVSKRELKKFAIQKDLAELDEAANRKYLQSERIAQRAVKTFHAKKVLQAHDDKIRFGMYKKRFKVLAPHDGIVRHAQHPWRRRKIKQGDGMRPGKMFAYIAKDKKIEMRIIIPERYYQRIFKQKTFHVLDPNGDSRFLVDVEFIESFPQTLGYVKQNQKLSNAEDIVYVVHGKFREQPAALKTGLEVKVER